MFLLQQLPVLKNLVILEDDQKDEDEPTSSSHSVPHSTVQHFSLYKSLFCPFVVTLTRPSPHFFCPQKIFYSWLPSTKNSPNPIFFLPIPRNKDDQKIEQVRLSRATLEFQVPTGRKVFSSQVIYLFSLTKIFRSKKSSIPLIYLPDTFLPIWGCF